MIDMTEVVTDQGNRFSDYLVEIVDRSGMVRERVSLGHRPLVLGRAYDSDIIIDDAYLSPHHVRIWLDENMQLHVEDLNSVNGLSMNRHGDRVKTLTLNEGEDCNIGWTKLRFRSRNSKVAAARVDHSRQFIFNILQRSRWQIAFLVILVLQLVYLGWLEQASEVEWYTLLMAPATILVALSVWAFIWAIIGRMLVHRAMFFTHLAIGALLASISLLIESVVGYGLFIFDADFLSTPVLRISGFVISAATFYAHLHFATRIRAKVQLLSALFISSLITLSTFYVDYSYREVFSSSPQYTGSLKPPAFVIFKPKTPAAFFAQLDELKHEVDEAREEE
jgi:hypothetical protein